ncbi:MAG: hypothetical protein M5U35_02360 [Roseovarius sp.]|nr:hypothetical protein [Roseovarius sp.]
MLRTCCSTLEKVASWVAKSVESTGFSGSSVLHLRGQHGQEGLEIRAQHGLIGCRGAGICPDHALAR